MPAQRLFVAIAVPEAVRRVLAGLKDPAEAFAWTPFSQLHLTLRFLGDTEEDRAEAARQRLRAVKVEPFLLPIEGVGAFPFPRAAHVVWAGVGRGHPRLHQLRQKVDDALLAAGLDLDVRTFHPHVTLARCEGGDASRWLRAHPDFQGPPFRVEAFGLHASTLGPGGAVHSLVEEFALL